MTVLQTDILELYNMLVTFSDKTVKSKFPIPIHVSYDIKGKMVKFEQSGKVAFTHLLNNYCLGLLDLAKPTYLLPEDYDYLMSSLQGAIVSGELLKDRTCLSPENYGFNLFATPSLMEPEKGPSLIGEIRIVSGTSWLFKYRTKRKYKL